MSDILSELMQIIIPVAHAAQEAVNAKAGSGDVLGKLGIDIKLFLAQLLNFGIVLFVLSKYVFGPVSKRLQERTEKIDTALRDAEKIEQEKEEFSQWKQEEMIKARKEASEIINKAQTEALQVKDGVLAQTKTEQEKLISQAQVHISEQEKKMLSDVKGEVADMVTQAAEKVLRHKLSSASDKKLIEESINSIK